MGVKVAGRKGEASYVEADEPIRRDSTLEKLAALPPIDEGGTVTAGNAPGVTDGAGALVLASESFAERRDLEPLGTMVATPRSPRSRRTCSPCPATREAGAREGGVESGGPGSRGDKRGVRGGRDPLDPHPGWTPRS